MKTSQTITKITPALLKAQKDIGSAKKGSTNPFFKSSYADLGEIMEVCKEPLNTNGILVLQPVGITENGGEYVETILLHETGEFISSKMKITPSKTNDPQSQGSAISYAKRYSLQAMLFIPSEDDDGEKAMARPKTYARPATATAETKLCPIHKVQMKKFTKGSHSWYSHKLEDGTWCSGK